MTTRGVVSGDSKMRLFILGATGGIGSQLVEQALARGHRVTALVRSPERMGRSHERLTILGGDPLDTEQLRRTLPDHDVVISAIGPTPRPGPSLPAIRILPKSLRNGNGRRVRSEHSVHRDLARSLVLAMESAAVWRLLVVSSAFVFSDFSDPGSCGTVALP
jgi:putative NADH-flavin reductase